MRTRNLKLVGGQDPAAGRCVCFHTILGDTGGGGVLKIRALLFGIYIRTPDFWELPCRC